ncbi:Hypothetical_protein [Hexamita inflata]|uniref:Hypothetical_protein n=1 Tax=Hexamita inflata TaxID=28002 RepID=A0AA86QSY7_9EUKA|nr:Hypothetical protein HINF_LOCUS47842 [Hexamita inflata]
MTNSSDSGISVALDFVLGGHSISTQQALAVRVELFVQNLKSVFYQVEEFIIGQISEIVDGVSNAYPNYLFIIIIIYFLRIFELNDELLENIKVRVERKQLFQITFKLQTVLIFKYQITSVMKPFKRVPVFNFDSVFESFVLRFEFQNGSMQINLTEFYQSFISFVKVILSGIYILMLKPENQTHHEINASQLKVAGTKLSSMGRNNNGSNNNFKLEQTQIIHHCEQTIN